MFRNIQNFPFKLDASIRSKAAIGTVILATDHTIEHEFKTLFDIPNVAVYASRIKNDVTVTKETLAAMEHGILNSCNVILPGMPLDVIAYGCTSASMVIGPAKIKELCQIAKPNVQVTEPLTAVTHALKSLKVTKFALVTPYRHDINLQMKDHFAEKGLEVVAMASFNQEDDNIVGQISPESIGQACLEIGKDEEVEAVFVSCTNMRIVEKIDELEEKLGKPVTSSNHALAWHALKLAGISNEMAPGKLFKVQCEMH